MTSNRKFYFQFRSIKRAFCLMNTFDVFKTIVIFVFAISVSVKLLNELDKVKRSAFKSEQSQNVLCESILNFMEDTDKNYHSSIHQHIASDFGSEKITNIKVVVLHVNDNVEIEIVPACKKYENYLKILYTNGIPAVFNIFMFYGDHGLGKTYAAIQFAKTLSKYTNVVLISLSMEAFLTYNDINVVTVILKKLETKLSQYEGKYKIIWLFDELDTYLKNYISVNNYRKTLTEFAESAGFVDGKNKILMFAMNNGDMFKHNYWTHNFKSLKCNNTIQICVDFNRALEFTSMTAKNFLTQGELNRLYSFMDGNIFRYKNLNVKEALTFAHNYQVEHFHNNNFSCIDEKINLFDKYNLRVLINNVHVCV
jgi:hypothetical protein